MPNFNEIYRTVYEIRGKIHLRPYVKKALLWISALTNQNWKTTFVKFCHIDFEYNLSISTDANTRDRLHGLHMVLFFLAL